MIDNTWTWRQLSPAASPPARTRAQFVWDPVNRRGRFYGGGVGDTAYDDFWDLLGDEWIEQSPSATPGARSGHHMATDGSRLLVVGGVGPGPAFTNLNNTWEYPLSGATSTTPWSEIATTFTWPGYSSVDSSTPTLAGSDLCFDTINSVFWFLYPFGGTSPVFGDGANRMLKFESDDWSEITPTVDWSAARDISGGTELDTWYVAMTWAGDRLVGKGGYFGDGAGHFPGTNSTDTKEFASNTWRQTVDGMASYTQPGTGLVLQPYVHQQSVTWCGGTQVLHFGGNDGNYYQEALLSYDTSDGTYTYLNPLGTGPSKRSGHVAIWTGHRYIVSHGQGPDGALDDTWALEPPTTYSISHTFGLRP